MSGRLNMLAVGSNPKILYYLWRLQATNKLNIHLVNEEIADSASPQIAFQDDTVASQYSLQPDIVARDFNSLTKVKYDLVLISSKSLQDISNISTGLVPFLGKKTIILIESTGFVNLEPFLKNCLPQELQLAVFSIVSTVDVRRVSRLEYVVKDTAQRDIIVGESGTINSKYSTSTQQDLGALVKLLQFQQADSAKVSSKSTYLEFLVEQWKLAIPNICFNPLLILFEEQNPSDLTQQILAKPLLSGLVTELITVAKTMGCKLPVGFDNESNLLKRWIEENKSSTQNNNVKFLDAPLFFYNFFHKNNLDIDMLLLQPILLADDHGIKTPYLEFLYATICQYDKLNNGTQSLFFKRADGIDTMALNQENDRLNSTLSTQIQEYKALLRHNEDLQMQIRELSGKDTKLNQIMASFENLQLEQQQLQQKFQQKSAQLQQAESRIQYLQSQPAPVSAPAPAPVAMQRSVQQQQAPQQAVPEAPQQSTSATDPYPHQQQQTPQSLASARMLQQHQVSVDGTPDLRDLTDVALYSAAMESPTRNEAPPMAESTQEEVVVVSPTQQPPPVLQLPAQSQQQQQQYIPQQHNQQQQQYTQDGLSARELELKKKEALLNSREMELNKKWSHMNNSRHPQQLQPPLQPMKQRASHIAPLQIPQQPQPYMGGPQSAAPSMGGPQASHPMGPQQMPQPRRVSTMPVMESEQLYHGINGGGMGMMNGAHNPQFKKTSRKNRKSSFPIVTPGLNDNYSQIRPANQDPMRRHQSLMTGSQPMMSTTVPPATVTSPMGNGNAYSPTMKPNPQFQQKPRASPNGSMNELNDNSYPTSNSNSSNEMMNGNSVQNGSSLQIPNGNGYAQAPVTADTSFGSVNNEEVVDAKPLGSVGAPLGAIGGSNDDKKKKKKFGMFGKK